MPQKRRRIARSDDCPVHTRSWKSLIQVARWGDRPLLLGSPAQATAWAGDPDQPGGALPSGDCFKLLVQHVPQSAISAESIQYPSWPALHIPQSTKQHNQRHLSTSATETATRLCRTAGVSSPPLFSRPSFQIISSRPIRWPHSYAQENHVYGVVMLACTWCFLIVSPDFQCQRKKLQPIRITFSTNFRCKKRLLVSWASLFILILKIGPNKKVLCMMHDLLCNCYILC